jgi:DNA polymerase III epsilon subunit family exonuclease
MEELTILTRQEPGIAELYNFDEIKAYLDERLDAYRNLVYSEDSLKTAKEDKAQLNKLKRALDTRRKEIKAIYMEPYLRIEAQIKELTAMIDGPLAAIDGFVKDMEAEEKRQKRELIREWYLRQAAPLEELKEKVFDAPGFIDPKWLNKSCKAAEWQSAVREKIAKAAADISAIQNSAGAHTAAVLTKYLDGMDLEAAKAYKRELEATAQVANTEISTVEDEDRTVGFKILKVSGTQRQMEQLLEYADMLGLGIDELEDGMPQPMRELPAPDFDSFVAFDIETSGSFGAASGDKPAEITEIGASKIINGQAVEWKDWFCNPGRKIVPRIARLTHITDDMVADAPPVEQVIREFAEFVGDLPLVGHNIKSSDLHYITRALKRAGIAMDNGFFDTYLYAKTLKDRYGWENVKLEYLSQIFGIEQQEAHRAYCDAEANVGVYFKLRELSKP